MSLVRLENVTKTYEPNLILDDLTWQIAKGDRIGLIGANGTGKTTLLELIAGVEPPTTGRIFSARGLRIGYLRQRSDLSGSASLRSVMEGVFEEQRALEEQMHALSAAMAEAQDEDELRAFLDRYDRLQHRHEVAGGYDYEHRIDSILRGLGFAEADFEKPVGVLSGGEKSRAGLARLLLEEPELLLLDEPTNHLDVQAIEWLESFLRSEYRGTYLVVAHDRYFLDRVTQKTVELRGHRLIEYRGNYSQYLKTRARDELAQARAFERQQKHIAHEEEYIRRNIAGQKSREAQGRRKRLERLERIERPDASQAKMRLRFEAQERGGNDVLSVTDLAVRFGEMTLFEGIGFDVARRDTLGIMGPNGAGKTTLFRVVLGELEPSQGEIRLGAGLHIGYLDQQHDDLDADRSVLDEIWQEMPFGTPQLQVRSYLARFLFSGDDVEKRVGDLSGGEKTRLALAKLLLGKPNLLLLDEPTNHLDIPSREAVEEALVACPATILLISHDRYLLSKLATKLLIFVQGRAEFWEGSYEEWERYNAEQTQQERNEKTIARSSRQAKQPEKQQEPANRKRKKKKRRPRNAIGGTAGIPPVR